MSREPFDRSTQSTDESTDQDRANAQNTAEKLKDRAKRVVSTVKDKADQIAGNVGETMDRQRQTAAGGLEGAASTLREKAEGLPGSSKTTAAGQRLAECMESTATYLREHDLSAMGEDLIGLCKRYPMQTLLAALVAGIFIGRSARRD